MKCQLCGTPVDFDTIGLLRRAEGALLTCLCRPCYKSTCRDKGLRIKSLERNDTRGLTWGRQTFQIYRRNEAKDRKRALTNAALGVEDQV